MPNHETRARTSEPARIGAAVLAVVLAGAQLAGYALSPEDQEALRTIIEAVVTVALVMGAGEWVRSRVSPVR